jgi:hypothetical protein
MTVFTKQRSWVFGLFVTVLLLLLCPEARAAIDVTEADLQAMSHALGFLDTMPRAGSLAVGIVYSAAAPDGKALAQQTADRLSGVTGPNTTKFQPTLIPV